MSHVENPPLGFLDLELSPSSLHLSSSPHQTCLLPLTAQIFPLMAQVNSKLLELSLQFSF